MAASVSTFLMFDEKAEEAIELYQSLFDDAKLVSIKHYGPETAHMEGKIMLAELVIGGHSLLLSNSSAKHDFSFTPAMSIFVQCESEEELTQKFNTLSEGGAALMPIDNYGFSKMFGWCQDRFGVSWQLNLPA